MLANAAVDSADTATLASVVTATDMRAVSDEPEPIAEAAATSLAAIHQIAVSRPSVATPNARVANAFSAIPLNATTVLTKVGAALPAPVIEAKFDTRSSANAIVAAEFRAVASDAVMPSDVTSSLRKGRMLQARASLEGIARRSPRYARPGDRTRGQSDSMTRPIS